MQTNKKELEKSQIEFEVTLSLDEFNPYLEKGAQKLAKDVKVEGFRPGKVPYDVLKQKVGEMAILEESANIAIRATIDEVLDKNLEGEQLAGKPQVEIVKLAPNNDFTYKVTMPVLPKVKLGQYKDLSIKDEQNEVDDKEIEKTLEQLKEMKAKESAKDGQAETGDKLTLDISMSIDGAPVEGGESKDTTVVLGKDYFLPGFDEKLLGAKKDETKEFSLTYPKDHHQKHLAGKNVDFSVKVKEVTQREVPEFNDDFAKTLQFNSMSELKEAIKKNVLAEKEKKESMRKERELMETLIEKSDIGEIPEEVVKDEAKGMLEEMKKNVEAQGGKFEDYLSHLKKTEDQLLTDFMPDAVKRIKIALILKEVGKEEKISVSSEEIDNKIEELKKTYAGQEEAQKQINSLEYKRHLNHALLSDKIVKKLKEWNYADSSQK